MEKLLLLRSNEHRSRQKLHSFQPGRKGDGAEDM